MANPVQLNLSPFLQTHYQTLSTHPGSPLKEYYSRPDVLARVRTTYINALKETVPKTTVCGGGLGCVVAWLIGLGVPGTVLSGVGGAAGGAATGIVYETVRLAIDIRLDEDYINWKNSIEAPILEDFAKILETHEPFKKFLCNITHDFPEIPVRDSFERLYNQEAIFKWIDEKGTNPFTRKRMTRKDVSFCPNFARKLSDEMVLAFGDPAFIKLLGRHPDEIIKGLKSILNTIITNHNNIIYSRAKQETVAAERRGLSVIEIVKINQTYMANFIYDIPKIEKPKGLAAILTIESIKDLDCSLVKEVQVAACEVASRLVKCDHEE